MVSLIDLLSNTYAPIQDSILPHLGIADVINLTLTCKGFGQLQPYLMATSYKINPLLGEFFDDPLEFRSLQGKSGAIITGDVVRGWFRRSTTPGSRTLRIYVYTKHRDAIINYVEKNGYGDALTQEESFCLAMIRTSTASWVHRILICDYEETPVALLFSDSKFTSDLCFIAWNKAYALFPYTTFIKRECYTLEEAWVIDRCYLAQIKEGLSVKTVSWAHPYSGSLSDSDLLNISSLSHDCEDIKELERRRRIGDEHTWSIELDTKGIDECNSMDASIESCTFRLSVWDNSPAVQPAHYILEFDHHSFLHPVLKHMYIVLDKQSETSYYTMRCEALHCRLNELALVELSKIPPENRPAEYSEIARDISKVSRLLEDFVPPDTWTFYDDEVIAFLDKIWKIQRRIDKKEEASRKKQFEALLTE